MDLIEKKGCSWCHFSGEFRLANLSTEFIFWKIKAVCGRELAVMWRGRLKLKSKLFKREKLCLGDGFVYAGLFLLYIAF